MAAEPNPPTVRSCRVMARLTLSALERASAEPRIWREPAVHHAVLISGLAQLQDDLG